MFLELVGIRVLIKFWYEAARESSKFVEIVQKLQEVIRLENMLYCMNKKIKTR